MKNKKKFNIIIVFLIVSLLSIVIVSMFMNDSLNSEDYESASKIYVYNGDDNNSKEESLYKIITDEYVLEQVVNLIGNISINNDVTVDMEQDYLYYIKLVNDNEEVVVEFNINPDIEVLNNSHREDISKYNYNKMITLLDIEEKIVAKGLFIETITEYLFYTNDSVLYVISDSTGKYDIFDNCSIGDTVEIELSMNVNTSDPLQVGAYSCKVINEGNSTNLSDSLIDLIYDKGFELK